ncbi:MAG: hypothetical protein ACI4S3_00870 [Candidatus Gastranaerophilaceae bacterium]
MSINFGARVRLNEYKTVKNINITPSIGLPSMASSGVSGTATVTSASATKTSASAASTIGYAFSSKASGINSSGIVPAVVESATPYATPATIASSKAHPSLMGTFFSAVGQFFNSLVKVHVKNPSR